MTATCITSLILLAPGCGGEGDDTSGGRSADDAAAEFEDAARSGDVEAMREAAERGAEASEVTIDTIANAERLRGFLPETVAGMERRWVNVDAAEASDRMIMAEASADYSRDGNAVRLSVSVSDVGSMSSMLGMIRDGVDMEADGVRARSFRHEGFLGLETLEEDGTVELQVRVGDRLLVALSAEGLTPEQARAALEQIDFTQLAEEAADGTLASRLPWQSITLPEPSELEAAIPGAIGDWTLAQAPRSLDLRDNDQPAVRAFATWTREGASNRPMIEVTLHQSPAHAAASIPSSRDTMAAMLGGFDPERMQFTEPQVNGSSAMVLVDSGRGGFGSVRHDRVVITVRNGEDAEQIATMLEAIDPAPLLAIGQNDE